MIKVAGNVLRSGITGVIVDGIPGIKYNFITVGYSGQRAGCSALRSQNIVSSNGCNIGAGYSYLILFSFRISRYASLPLGCSVEISMEYMLSIFGRKGCT